MSGEVCFPESDLKLYLFILFLFLIYGLYVYLKSNENMSNINFTQILTREELQNKITELQDELYNTKLSDQKCQIELNSLQEQSSLNLQTKLLNKIYNPLTSPERIYPGGRINMQSYSNYQLIGFIFKDEERYPLYGRPKYAGKTDKYEYYIIDESRNRLKIPFKTRNDNELYSGDQVNIPGVGDNFQVTIYEYDTLRYDPAIF